VVLGGWAFSYERGTIVVLGTTRGLQLGPVRAAHSRLDLLRERFRSYRGTSLIRKRLLLGPYSRPVHRAL